MAPFSTRRGGIDDDDDDLGHLNLLNSTFRPQLHSAHVKLDV